MYLSRPVLDSLWSLSYLSTKYSKIARVSLRSDQPMRAQRLGSEHLPDGEVVVMVVDDGWDATVGVDLQVFWTLLLFLAEIEVHGLVRQPELLKNDGDFPKSRIGRQVPVNWGEAGTTYQPLGPPLWVYKVNCFP